MTRLVGNDVVNAAVAGVVLVFGEIVPKSHGLGHAETWATRVARPTRLVERLISPLLTVFGVTTRRTTALVGGDSGVETTLDD